MKRGGGGNYKSQNRKPPHTPDPRSFRAPPGEEANETVKLHQKPCKFWKFGKCNWGWGCRFLHGNTLDDDPRRPEYRGPAIDFTQFPRPMATSPISQLSHTDDQSRIKQIRNPLVEIVVSGNQGFALASVIKDICLRNFIDVLYFKATTENPFPIMTSEAAKEKISSKSSDFIIFIDFNVIILYPDSVSVTQQNISDVIHRRWDIMNNNLSLDQIELLSMTDIEAIITKLTSLENIATTVGEFQDETSNIISSLSLENCRTTQQQLVAFRKKLTIFFGRLNLANSIIADMPLYATMTPIKGSIVPSFVPSASGLSPPMQRVLSYTIGVYLTQIHVCTYHINKLLNEFVVTTSCFPTVASTSISIHPTPLCALPIEAIFHDDIQRYNIEYGRRLEPDVNVDVRTPYYINFRDTDGTDPFNHYFQGFGPGKM